MWKKIVNKIRGSLTVRIFAITTLILAAACAVTFGFLAWATPATYLTIVTSDLEKQTEQLVGDLSVTKYDDCGPLLDQFVVNVADVMVIGPDGNIVNTPSSLATMGVWETETYVVASTPDSQEVQTKTGTETDMDSVAVTATATGDLTVPFAFQDREETYTLHVSPRSMAVTNQVLMALWKVAPQLAVALLVFSTLCAWFYSRYITRPIVRLRGISQKMANMEFTWQCNETRPDEIGQLGRNLDAMSVRLSTALVELRAANEALQRDIDRERAMERQRTAFFSAASHELKTPVTILKGQLSGMLAGVNVYQDRDKYLARSLAVTNRMENLIQEMLTVSRMERAEVRLKRDPVDLSALVSQQAAMLTDLTEQRKQTVECSVLPDLMVWGDKVLLERAIANLLSNASVHSPEGARIQMGLTEGETGPKLTVSNSGAAIPEPDLPHIFEAFYRVDSSRNRATGGSGLGLYLVSMILDRHGAVCHIENAAQGVLVTVEFTAGEGLSQGCGKHALQGEKRDRLLPLDESGRSGCDTNTIITLSV